MEIAAIFSEREENGERLAVNKLSFPNNRSSYVRRLLTEYLTKDTAVSQKCQQNVSKIAQRHEYKLPSAAKMVRTALRQSGLRAEDNDEGLLNLKPDIVIKQENKLIILDIACPYDLYLAELYEAKINKYRDLQRYLTTN